PQLQHGNSYHNHYHAQQQQQQQYQILVVCNGGICPLLAACDSVDASSSPKLGSPLTVTGAMTSHISRVLDATFEPRSGMVVLAAPKALISLDARNEASRLSGQLKGWFANSCDGVGDAARYTSLQRIVASAPGYLHIMDDQGQGKTYLRQVHLLGGSCAVSTLMPGDGVFTYDRSTGSVLYVTDYRTINRVTAQGLLEPVVGHEGCSYDGGVVACRASHRVDGPIGLARFVSVIDITADEYSSSGTAGSAAMEPLRIAAESPPDVVIIAGDGGTSFPAHRAVLSARCLYFRKLFSASFGGGGGGGAASSGSDDIVEVPLRGTDPDALAVVLRHIYTGSFEHLTATAAAAAASTSEPLRAVAALADRLLLPQLCAHAQELLLRDLAPDTVVSEMLWAERAGLQTLLAQLEQYFVVHAAEVAQQAPQSVDRLLEGGNTENPG
ncbi:hypothetical protein VOLCADRAFT_87741, partial [Volvox carteri f. nagariensis]